jgi:hypothetical protein
MTVNGCSGPFSLIRSVSNWFCIWQDIRRVTTRVTRLGEFSPIWRLILWAVSLRIYWSGPTFCASFTVVELY